MSGFSYFYHGLRIGCDFELVELASFRCECPHAADDVSVVLDANYLESQEAELLASAAPQPGEYRFYARNTALFCIRNGTIIEISRVHSAPERGVRLYLLGSAWAALLYQRGTLVFHASAVLMGGGAVLFCGRRGSGKSTAAAFLGNGGFDLLSDDMCCVVFDKHQEPVLYPSVPRIKLLADAATHLGWTDMPAEPGYRVPKSHYLRPRSVEVGFVKIAGICLLGWGELALSPLAGITGLRSFMAAATWRPDLLHTVADSSSHVVKCAELLSKVPLWTFHRPRDLGHIRISMNFLTRALEDSSF